MKVYLDECVDRRLAPLITGHEVRTARQMGWTGVKNGELLKRVAEGQFDAFVTVDRNLSFQQNVAVQPFAVLVLHAKSNRLADLARLLPNLLAMLPTARTGRATAIDES